MDNLTDNLENEHSADIVSNEKLKIYLVVNTEIGRQ